MDFTAKDAAVYSGANNKAQKSEPKTDLALIKSQIYNKLLSLPQADAPFPDVSFSPLPPEVFQDISKWTDCITYLTEEKYNDLNEEYKKTLTDDDYDDDLNCPMCVVGLYCYNPKKPTPFPTDEIVDLLCGHPHHKECLQFNLQSDLGGTQGRCSRCTRPFFYCPGDQPLSSKATVSYDETPCPGYESNGTIIITFDISAAPNAEQPTYITYLPATPVVLQQVLKLYIKTFLLGQLFPLYRDNDKVGLAAGLELKNKQSYPDNDFVVHNVNQFEALGIQLSPDEIAIE